VYRAVLMRLAPILLVTCAVLALTACNGPSGSATTAAPSASAAPPPVPKPSAAPSAPAPGASAVSPAPSAPAPSASGSASAGASWLKLGPGESVTRMITTGTTAGCAVVKTRNGDEIRCPPAPAPAATVDELEPNGKSCPAGFEVSGANFCSRACKTNKDCHGKHVCGDMKQCMNP